MSYCHFPVPAVETRDGEFELHATLDDAAWYARDGEVRQMPCSRCAGCLKYRSLGWAVRAQHELLARTDRRGGAPNASFVTLTYSDAHLPEYGYTQRSDFSEFIKDTREAVPEADAEGLVWLGCAEYGGKTFRPHYHAIMYGVRWDSDRRYISSGPHGPLYSDDLLEEVWGRGHVMVQDINGLGAVARYVAGYTMKNVGYDDWSVNNSHWEDSSDGTRRVRTPPDPEILVSTQPGVGLSWLRRNFEAVYPADEVHLDGGVSRPPKAYDRECSKQRPDLWAQTLEKREEWRKKHAEVLTDDQLRAKRSNFEARRHLRRSGGRGAI